MNGTITAAQAARKEISYIDGLANLREAITLMKASKTTALIVNKRNDADAFGIIVLTDIARYIANSERKAEDISVYEVMTKPAVSIPPSMNIRYAIRLLLQTGYHSAPVEENGAYIGLLFMDDVVLENL
jgi:predicted transcriptional regulator